jgi:hypothetical protein
MSKTAQGKPNSATQALTKLLETTSHWDKDERYMATNDLCTMLQNYVVIPPPPKDQPVQQQQNPVPEDPTVLKMDENLEQRVCAAVLKQLGKGRDD